MKFLVSTLLASAAAVVLAVPLPAPTPPGIPTDSTARTLLNGLKVGTPQDTDSYNRDLFPHWKTISGTCNAREFVLKRDGTGVTVNAACTAQSGSWKSPYDDKTWTQASDIDIDHMVPLKNAWISGASKWTTAQRTELANDVTRPQLWAVTDSLNQAKGDKSPDVWTPPVKTFHCTYAKSWIQVKSYYKLSITAAEKGALSGMLDTC